MAHAFASQQWIDALWAELRSDETVRSLGATWVSGPLLLVVDADADAGVTDAVPLRLDLHEGEARDLRIASASETRLAPFAIRGTYARWKTALQGSEDVVDGVLRGVFSMRGDLPALTRHRGLVRAVMAAATRVATSWPDDAASDAQGQPGAPAGAAR